MSIATHHADKLIERLGALYKEIRAAQFPRLMVETVTDDGETFEALRCPRCQGLVDADDLYAVSPAESWDHAYDVDSDAAIENRTVTFYAPGGAEWGDTLYYLHHDHAVTLPEGWQEEWV